MQSLPLRHSLPKLAKSETEPRLWRSYPQLELYAIFRMAYCISVALPYAVGPLCCLWRSPAFVQAAS